MKNIKSLNEIWTALHKADLFMLNDSHSDTLIETHERIKKAEELVKQMISKEKKPK
jgi:hypothetical protein